MMMNKALSYDAEIEYLESNGTQLINSGFTARIGDAITIIFSFEKQPFGSDLLSCFNENDAINYLTFSYIRNIGNGQRGVRFQYFSNIISTVQYTFVLNTWNTLHIDASGKATFNNITITSAPISEIEGDNNTLKLFAGKFAGRIQSLTIEREGINVLQLISVRKGNVGYMYDKVSGKLFGNAGTGQFILGPDKMGGVIKWLIINTLRGLSNPSLEERRVA
ncbi:MAG: hypothetical protein II950_05635 [Prevotella sp.]|nr:hypothetical protein [Prevotella sp.]